MLRNAAPAGSTRAAVMLATLVVGVLFAGWLAQPAHAQDPAPTLTDWTMTSPPIADVTVTCENGELRYHSEGITTGPYPGTFVEDGVVEIAGGEAGQIVQLTVNFTVEADGVVITGQKFIVAPLEPPSGGACSLDQVELAAVDVQYRATIESLEGRCTDSGTASISLLSNPFETSFTETFVSLQGATECQPTVPTGVTLSPPTDVKPVDTTQTVTTTVLSGTSPAEGVTVLLTVDGSVTTSGSCTTDAAGKCDFTYKGPDFPGTDAIVACVDANGNGRVDDGELCTEATNVWVAPAATPGHVTGGGWIVRPDGSRVSFGFNAKSDAEGTKGNCNLIDHGTKQHVKCDSVDTLVVSGTHATFYGAATVDDVPTRYRLDVDDLGEPGTSDTFKLRTDSGFYASGVLSGGNIQIHKR